MPPTPIPTPTTDTDAAGGELEHRNLAVVVGDLTSLPVRRDLPSGAAVVSFALTVRDADHATVSVPCAWFDPPARVDRWQVGDRVLTVGRIVRRFYRAGGATASRTELAVDGAESSRHRRQFQRLRDRVPGTEKIP